jgi:hypothetical protein
LTGDSESDELGLLHHLFGHHGHHYEHHHYHGHWDD